MADRFDLEQQILQAWNITDDLDLFIKQYDAMSEDEKLNFIIGILAIYNVKFQRLFETFETLIKQGVIK